MFSTSNNHKKGGFIMEDNNNQEQNEIVDTTYHYGRNESPYSRESISGDSIYQEDMNSQDTTPHYMDSTILAEEIEKEKKQKEKKEKKEKRKKTCKKVAAFTGSAVAFGLVAGCVMFGVNKAGNAIFGSDDNATYATEIPTVSTSDTSSNEEKADAVADVVENVMPSIVSITNKSVQTVQSWFRSYEREVIGAGSGIIIGQTKDEILIVTNNHVIDGAKEITISFDEDHSVAAKVRGVDSISDLAVLSVETKDMESDTLSGIKVAALGSSDGLRVGEPAIAIGNALGYGQSVTVGYISALSRDVQSEDGSMIQMLQTDAAINPGNSGGALLNSKGEVIGINSAKYVDSTVEGMGYAIPISDAIPIINDLMNSKVIKEDEQGYLGIQGNNVTEEYAQGFNMPKGVYVVKILDDSPANECGLKAGDIITGFAGRDISSMENLQSILSTKKAGEEVEMVIQRNNEKGEYEEVKLSVKLGAKKDMPSDATDKDESESEKTTEQTTEQTSEERQESNDFFDNPEQFFDDFEYFFER